MEQTSLEVSAFGKATANDVRQIIVNGASSLFVHPDAIVLIERIDE